MNIKIMCSCGTKFAFEVEPVDGRMPFAINCPSCGIDGTAFANHYVSQALANPGTEALVVVPVTDDEPAPNAAGAEPAIEPEPAPRARLAVQPKENAGAPPAEGIPTVEGEAPAAAAPHRLSVKRAVAEEAAAGGTEPPGRAAEPMLLNLDAEREKRMAEIQAARAREKQFWSKVAWAARGVVMFVLLLLGAYFWYYFSGSKPKEFYTVTLQGDEYSARSRLIGPHELVVLDSAGVTLHDLKSGQSVWTTALTGSEGASGGGGRFGYRGSNHADLHVTDSDIWALSQNRLFQLDRASGDQKKSIALAGSVLQFAPSPRDILIVSSAGEQRRSVMRVDLATGASTVQAVELPAAQQTSATAQFGAPRLPTQGNLLAEELELHGKLQLAKLRTDLLAAGENVARVEVRLVTAKVVSVKVMKDSGESRLDGKVTAAANPMAIAEDLMNEQKRASGDMYREVDESTYEVTLTRVLAKGAATWRGTLTGRPEFFR